MNLHRTPTEATLVDEAPAFLEPESEEEAFDRFTRLFKNDMHRVPDTERMVTNPVTGASKGQKEARFDLIPVEPLTELARHYGKGSEKYSPRNWERGYEWSLSYAALQRHANLFWGGEDRDSETDTHHMAAVAFHALALIQFGETHPELDDRPGAYRPVTGGRF